LEDIIGRVVYSKSGRDKDRMFVLVKVINQRLCMVSDGELRKIENPKVKNIRHLTFTTVYAEDIKTILEQGAIPANHLIKKSLKNILESQEL